MKKFFMMAIAVAAMTFASCGNKTEKPVEEAIDSVAVLAEEANAAAEDAISQLSATLEQKDASALQTALEAIKAKVAEFIAVNPGIAKEYISKVQNFLKENAEAVKAVVGTNATISGLVDGIAALPTESVEALTGATDALKALGIDASNFVKDAASDAVDAAADAVEGAKDAAAGAVDAAGKAVDNAKDAASNAVEGAKDAAGKAVDNAADATKKALGI
ncbi:MAG: hypothetical protein IKW98_05270 [Prevotella sp.]|nr:hypothetical protein [Prevotella sp.]